MEMPRQEELLAWLKRVVDRVPSWALDHSKPPGLPAGCEVWQGAWNSDQLFLGPVTVTIVTWEKDGNRGADGAVTAANQGIIVRLGPLALEAAEKARAQWIPN